MEAILFLLFWMGGATIHTVLELHLSARRSSGMKALPLIRNLRVKDKRQR
ncbi:MULTISPECIES: hypothetical protein [Desulfosediminicola]|nr:hypothetical protein [Desulfosediminicola ganghwensis]